MKKSFLIIGMGHFGQNLAKNLTELGNSVMIVDKNEDIINSLSTHYDNAFIGNCTNIDVLKKLGVTSFDAVFVAIAQEFQSSLEVTSLLKDLGAIKVISKAKSEIQAKFLSRSGADEVIYPEYDIAQKGAIRYSARNIFDYIELTDEFGIYEISVPSEWIGHSLRELEIRTKYNLTVIAIKQSDNLFPMPSPNNIFVENDHVVLIGKSENILKLSSVK